MEAPYKFTIELRKQTEIEKACFTFISRPVANANTSLLPIEKANRSLLCLMNAPLDPEASKQPDLTVHP